MSQAEPPSQWRKLPDLDDRVALDLYAQDLVQRVVGGVDQGSTASMRCTAVLCVTRNGWQRLCELMGKRS